MSGDISAGSASSVTPIRRVVRAGAAGADGGDCVEILDQRLLPFDEVWIRCTTAEDVWRAIRDMAIRGAPAIGVAAAYGLALGAHALLRDPAVHADRDAFAVGYERLSTHMAEARPTAVNLFWAIARMREVAARHADPAAAVAALDAEADAIRREDLAMNHAIGAHGLEVVPTFADRATRILTHCNTGSLATAGWGTALGVIRSAHARGPVAVFADETRPYLQGARLTAWELVKDGIDATLIADGAAGHLMARGEVDMVVVGADRIAENGDTANKIGTFSLAVLCRHHGIPFYVAAPTSTIDLATPDGAHIPIEERPASEVREVFGRPIAPAAIKVRNPSFDVTPGALVTAIINEQGVARAPYAASLRAACAKAGPRYGGASRDGR